MNKIPLLSSFILVLFLSSLYIIVLIFIISFTTHYQHGTLPNKFLLLMRGWREWGMLLLFFFCLYILCRLLIVYYVVLAYYIKENISIARACYLDLWSIVLCLHIIWINFKSPIHVQKLVIYCRVLALCNNLLLPISICFSILDWHTIIFKGVLMAYI